MNFLLDTHLLIWAGDWLEADLNKSPLSATALDLIQDQDNTLFFSPINVWEVAIKNSLRRPGFRVDPNFFRRSLIANGYDEVALDSRHAAAVGALPDLHKDPFDRLLVAQATIEGLTLLTSDKIVSTYPGPIRLV